MIPTFVSRRLRWVWLAGIGTTLWVNRRDVARWLRFARRSVAQRDKFDLQTWLTEARVRAAITVDPVLRCDPDLDDVVVEDGNVTIRTASMSWPDSVTHLNGVRKVKGVADVRCEPGELVGGTRVTSYGVPVI
ncbi:MAG: hypothetical protein Q7V88_07095 [Actinomycetota bacterium]|nr:hypothetical protein [Actinomycetota bacterium]